MNKIFYSIMCLMILLCTIFSGAINELARFFISGFSFFSGVYLLKKNPFERNIYGILLYCLPFLILFTPVEIYSIILKNFRLIPMYIISLLGIIFSLFFYKLSIRKVNSLFITSIILISILTYFLPNYFNYLYFKNNNILNSEIKINNLTDDNKIKIDTTKFNNKIIIIDFWSTSCGNCIEDFPKFEKLKKEFEKDNEIIFCSINIPVRNQNDLQALNLTKKYSFNKLYCDTAFSKSLNISSVPEYVILDKNKKVRYVGSLNTSNSELYNNFYTIINAIKKNQ